MNDEQQDVVVNLLAKMKGLGMWGAKPKAPIDGPVVTAFPFEVPDSLRLSKFLASEEDFALAVGVESLDIRRVGGELVFFVPNRNRRTVNFLDCLATYVRNYENMRLPIMLGTDFRGTHASLDLADAPHILIAGSTNSGKSIFESSIIASLAMKFSPWDLKMILVDTKRLDLPMFDHLPHVEETVTKVEQWYPMMETLMTTVEARKTKLEKEKVRNIWEYRAKGLHMPVIVLVIDELADLMEHDYAYRQMMKKKAKEDDSIEKFTEPTVEDALLRLVQICRAVGVHIIACTQRTSVDIISGTIKTNFPTRISLRLPTGTDSRTILGTVGAENLLGKGDMLIKKPDSDNVERYHGPFVRLEDVKAVLEQKEDILKMLGAA